MELSVLHALVGPRVCPKRLLNSSKKVFSTKKVTRTPEPCNLQSAIIELLTARGGKNTELKLQVGAGAEGGRKETGGGVARGGSWCGQQGGVVVVVRQDHGAQAAGGRGIGDTRLGWEHATSASHA